jgi:hypothetical protein
VLTKEGRARGHPPTVSPVLCVTAGSYCYAKATLQCVTVAPSDSPGFPVQGYTTVHIRTLRIAMLVREAVSGRPVPRAPGSRRIVTPPHTDSTAAHVVHVITACHGVWARVTFASHPVNYQHMLLCQRARSL